MGDKPRKGPKLSIPTPDDIPWAPVFNPTQQQGFDDTAKFILMYGEKGSGKTWGALNALVRHCNEERDAFAVIVAVNIRSGKMGTVYDLMRVLDVWRNGNIDKDGNRLDAGLGETFEYTEPALDSQTKDRQVFIKNKYGGWSTVLLMSIPYASVVSARMKNMSPSFVMLEEVTEMQSEDYLLFIGAQIGRRHGILGPQQLYACCNPEGPSHWVYQSWWVKCIDEKTGKRDPKYSVYHVPIVENLKNIPPDYQSGLDGLFKDPIVRARLLRGEWIDRPSGDAIFKIYYRESEHRVGNQLKHEGLMPWKQWPIIISYDPGPRNFSVHFEQLVPCKDKQVWLIFDEINLVGRGLPYFTVVPMILRRMDWWNEKLGRQGKFIHIGPADAFNTLNHEGTFDAKVIQALSKPAPNARPRIVLRACPTDPHSVINRVNMMISLLLDNAVYVSALCTETHKMFKSLESKKGAADKYDPNMGLEPKRSIYLHPFDSLTYAPYYFTLNPARFAAQTSQVTSDVFVAGRG